MSYTAEISRNNPGCFLFVIDQSGSMVQVLPDGRSKANFVADTINKFLQNLVIKCSKSEGIRDYFYVGVIGYGQDNKVISAFDGDLLGKELVPISEIANHPLEIQEREIKTEDDTIQKVKFPIWFNPIADGATPMKEAFVQVNKIIANWLSQNSNCFPPLVIHITDGEFSDGDPSHEMKQLMSQASSDGNVLVLNLHFSSAGHLGQILFPNSNEILPDDYAKMLFDNSSVLTPAMLSVAKEDLGIKLENNSRGFVFNGDMRSVINGIEIGTRPSINTRPNKI